MEDGLILAPNAMLGIDCFVDASFSVPGPHEEKLDPTCVEKLVLWSVLQTSLPSGAVNSKLKLLPWKLSTML